MKDMKNRVWRAISAVAMREHWRVRRVLLLVMVAVTALSMVTVKSMGDTVQPRRVYVVLTEDGRTEIISGRPSRDKSFGILETRVDYNAREAQLLLQHGHDITVTSGEQSRTVQTAAKRWIICSTGCIWSLPTTRWCSLTSPATRRPSISGRR